MDLNSETLTCLDYSVIKKEPEESVISSVENDPRGSSADSVTVKVQIRPLVQRLFNSDSSHKRKRSVLKKEDTYRQYYSDEFEINEKLDFDRKVLLCRTDSKKSNGKQALLNNIRIKDEPPEYCEYKEVKCEFNSGTPSEIVDTDLSLKSECPEFEEVTVKEEHRKDELQTRISDVPLTNTHTNVRLRKIPNAKSKLKSKNSQVCLNSKTSLKSALVPEELTVGVIDRRYTVEPISKEEILKLTESKLLGSKQLSSKKRKERHRCQSYRCKDCGEMMPSFKALREHAIVHQIETRHKCSACSKCFTRAHDLVLHARVHSGERPYVCQFCKKGFSQKINMIRHERIHTNERPFICTVCHEAFIDQGDLAKHSRNHTGRLPYFCIICKERFLHLEEMKEHASTSHLDGKVFPCPICGTVFYSRNLKKSHWLAEHSQGKPFECHDCGKRFKLKVHIIKHMNVHIGLRPYVCQYCNKRFAGDSGLRLHLQRHVGIKPQACPDCPLSFYNIGTLKRHMRTHVDGRPFPCEECHSDFKSQDSRSRHIKMVHRRSLGEYRCEFAGCDEVYSVKSNMQRHLRSFHYGMKPYVCDSCDACFTSKSSLVSHASSRHSKARDYVCQTCKKEFADRTSLSRHTRKHHGQQKKNKVNHLMRQKLSSNE